MRNRAAWELTERHQSLVTRTETLINELHSAGPAEAGGKGGGVPGAPKSLFSTEGNPLKTLPCLGGVDLQWICPDAHRTAMPWLCWVHVLSPVAWGIVGNTLWLFAKCSDAFRYICWELHQNLNTVKTSNIQCIHQFSSSYFAEWKGTRNSL